MENRRIETQRLILKPITLEDASAVFVWASDPEVNRYMPYPLHKSIEDTRAWIASITPDMLEFGFYRKDNGQLIGTGGVAKTKTACICWATTSGTTHVDRGMRQRRRRRCLRGRITASACGISHCLTQF